MLFIISLTFSPQNHKNSQSTEMYCLGNRNQSEKHEFDCKKPPPNKYILTWLLSQLNNTAQSACLYLAMCWSFQNFIFFFYSSSLYRYRTAVLESMNMVLKGCILKFMVIEKTRKYESYVCVPWIEIFFFNYIIWNHIG